MNKKAKILFCLPAFTYGGTVFSTLNMISFLKEEYDVYVLPMTYQGPVIEKYREAGIKLLPENRMLSAMMGRVRREHTWRNKFISIFHKSIRKALSPMKIDYGQILFKHVADEIERKYDFDYVASCQEGGATYFVSCFKRAKKIAWFRSEYSVYRRQLSDNQFKKEELIYSVFNRIVCVSQITRDDFCKWFYKLNCRVFAVHNIQFTDNILLSASEPIPDEFDNNQFNILSVGRFAPQKQFSKIPKIAKELKLRGINFNWFILGDGNMMGEYDRTQEAIKENSVEEVVKCIGSRINPYPYIKKANLLVCPSYYEACPRVVVESKILHTPVVAADFSSAKEFIDNDVNGFVTSVSDMSRIIGDLIENHELYDRIKTECDLYKIDNNLILKQLQAIFS